MHVPVARASLVGGHFRIGSPISSAALSQCRERARVESFPAVCDAGRNARILLQVCSHRAEGALEHIEDVLQSPALAQKQKCAAVPHNRQAAATNVWLSSSGQIPCLTPRSPGDAAIRIDRFSRLNRLGRGRRSGRTGGEPGADAATCYTPRRRWRRTRADAAAVPVRTGADAAAPLEDSLRGRWTSR